MDLTQELEKVIQKAAIDQTLTPKAVEHFQEQIRQAGDLKKEVERLEKRKTEQAQEIERVVTKNREYKDELDAYKAREASLVERENKARELELKAEYQGTRVQDHKDMMGIIFRNTEVRRNIYENRQEVYTDQYGTRQTGYPNPSTSTEVTEKHE